MKKKYIYKTILFIVTSLYFINASIEVNLNTLDKYKLKNIISDKYYKSQNNAGISNNPLKKSDPLCIESKKDSENKISLNEHIVKITTNEKDHSMNNINKALNVRETSIKDNLFYKDPNKKEQEGNVQKFFFSKYSFLLKFLSRNKSIWNLNNSYINNFEKKEEKNDINLEANFNKYKIMKKCVKNIKEHGELAEHNNKKTKQDTNDKPKKSNKFLISDQNVFISKKDTKISENHENFLSWTLETNLNESIKNITTCISANKKMENKIQETSLNEEQEISNIIAELNSMGVFLEDLLCVLSETLQILKKSYLNYQSSNINTKNQNIENDIVIFNAEEKKNSKTFENEICEFENLSKRKIGLILDVNSKENIKCSKKDKKEPLEIDNSTDKKVFNEKNSFHKNLNPTKFIFFTNIEQFYDYFNNILKFFFVKNKSEFTNFKKEFYIFLLFYPEYLSLLNKLKNEISNRKKLEIIFENYGKKIWNEFDYSLFIINYQTQISSLKNIIEKDNNIYETLNEDSQEKTDILFVLNMINNINYKEIRYFKNLLIYYAEKFYDPINVEFYRNNAYFKFSNKFCNLSAFGLKYYIVSYLSFLLEPDDIKKITNIESQIFCVEDETISKNNKKVKKKICKHDKVNKLCNNKNKIYDKNCIDIHERLKHEGFFEEVMLKYLSLFKKNTNESLDFENSKFNEFSVNYNLKREKGCLKIFYKQLFCIPPQSYDINHLRTKKSILRKKYCKNDITFISIYEKQNLKHYFCLSNRCFMRYYSNAFYDSLIEKFKKVI